MRGNDSRLPNLDDTRPAAAGVFGLLTLAIALLLPLSGTPSASLIHAQSPEAPAREAGNEGNVQTALSDARALAVSRELQRNIVDVIARVEPAFVRIGPGSGIIVSPDGYVLTNHHVTHDNHFRVTIGDGRTFRAVNVGQDPRGDIVLMKLDTRESLPYVEIGDSDALRPGQLAFALGNPFLYARDDARPSVSLGVISAVHRFQQGYADTIQTDTPMNPGNSGGPLLTLDGKLVGINGRIGVRRTFGTRINTGVGYAIPTNQIMRFVRVMRERGGLVRHGLIEGLRLRREEPRGDGVRVGSVDENSPAARAGLRAGDRIVAIDGRDVPSANRYWGVLGTYPEGWRLPVDVVRDGERLTLHVALSPTSSLDQQAQVPAAPRGNEARYALPAPTLSPTLPEHPPLRRAYLGVRIDARRDRDMSGCPIEFVVPNSPAARAGLQEGDILVAAAAVPLHDAEHLQGIVSTLVAGDRLHLEYRRRWFGFWRTYTVQVVLGVHPDDTDDDGDDDAAD